MELFLGLSQLGNGLQSLSLGGLLILACVADVFQQLDSAFIK